MGGKFSNMFGGKEEDEMDANLRRYQETMDSGGDFIGDEQDKQKVVWWEHLIYDKRFRIAYVFFLALILGIVIPIIIFATKLEKEDKPVYGSCLIKEFARFECLINSARPADKEACKEALCCWEDGTNLPFNCFHSFPSAYQYNVSASQYHTTGGEKGVGGNSKNVLSWTSVDMDPNQKDLKMSPLRLITHWESEQHLVVEVFNRDAFPDRTTPTKTRSASVKDDFVDADETLPFTVSSGEDKHFFFIRIARRDTDETIFDTRLGPVYTTTKEIVLATLLPTEYFYGLKGGQSSISTVTYGVVNGFENSEFPFYISYENSGQWHGVLIDTTAPFLAQVVQAPGLMLHFEMDRPEINMHFFAGPTQPQILEQLHSYIQRKHQITTPPMIPPYWGLGLHLCRRVENGSRVLEDMQELSDDVKYVVYDSDCIDEHLRNPIFFNETHFAPNLTDILNAISTKKILLSQNVIVPLPIPGEVEEEAIETRGIVTSNSSAENEIYFKDLLVLDTRNSSNIKPFLGQIGNETLVTYIDVFNAHLLDTDFPHVPPRNNESDSFPYHGFSLSDNIPKSDSSSKYCSGSSSKLQSYFIHPPSTSSNLVNVSLLYGSLCPHVAKHNLSSRTGYQNHQGLHNVYGEQTLKVVYQTESQRRLQANSSDEMLITSGSFWTSSLYYGAYNGMQVPFTWRGLQDSVTNTVRNYALAPVAGTPICGGMLENNVTFAMSNELCLRWFQFGLLLPFARNSYDGKSSFGPLQLPVQYRTYVNDAIKTRYTYAPYYYTELLKYQTTYVPLIRPMSFDFNRRNETKETLPLLTQFMVGDAILAAPIIERGVTRSAYFPAGIWYTMNGQVAWANEKAGAEKQITGYITETPMFMRGGYMIPTLQKIPEHKGLTIEETLQGNYTLVIALPTSQQQQPNQAAIGKLTVKEPNSNGTTHFIDFYTEVNYENTVMTITINSSCASNSSLVSTRIEHIHVFGLKFTGNLNITIKNSNEAYPPGTYEYFGEFRVLRIEDILIDWCKFSEFQVTVLPANDDVTETMPTTPSDATTGLSGLPTQKTNRSNK